MEKVMIQGKPKEKPQKTKKPQKTSKRRNRHDDRISIMASIHIVLIELSLIIGVVLWFLLSEYHIGIGLILPILPLHICGVIPNLAIIIALIHLHQTCH